MACVRKRRGKYVVDYRDCAGRRRWVTCDSKGDADDVLSRKIREAKQAAGIPCADPNITVSEYFAEWIEKVRLTSKPRTAETYADYARLHILKELGETKLRKLHRARIKTWLVGKLSDGYSRGTIKLLIAILRAMLNEALEDGILLGNPALRIGRTLKVAGREGKKARNEPKACTREQLAAFLASAHP